MKNTETAQDVKHNLKVTNIQINLSFAKFHQTFVCFLSAKSDLEFRSPCTLNDYRIGCLKKSGSFPYTKITYQSLFVDLAIIIS